MYPTIETPEQFKNWCPPGPALVLALATSDVERALLAPLIRHAERGDQIFLMTPQTPDGPSVLATLHWQHLSISAERMDERCCADVAERIERLRPARVYVPSCSGDYAWLALQVWEGTRRAAHQAKLVVGELSQPLPTINAWLPATLAHPQDPDTPFQLRRFRAAAAGRPTTEGNAVAVLDPKDSFLPAPLPAERRMPAQDERTAGVSVIVRTAGRDSLPAALDSVAAQTWPAVSLVLVNIREDRLPLDLDRGWRGLPVRVLHRPLASRAEAANAGLEGVSTPFFCFLDDDDLLYPSHAAHLVAALSAHPDRLVAYGGIRIESLDDFGQLREVSLLDEPFSLERLRLSNYIPIHACMARRDLIDRGIRFDPGLSHYEDWDFWLQLAEQAPFVHKPGTVGVYRVANSSSVSGQDPSPVYRRWLERAGAAQLSDIARWALSDQTPSARTLRQAVADKELETAGLHEQMQRRLEELDLARQRAAELQLALTESRDQLELAQSELADSLRDRDEQSRQLAEREREVAGARHELRTLYDSTSWRLTAPARALVTGVRSIVQAADGMRLLILSHGGGLKGTHQVGTRALRAFRRYGIRATLRRGHQMFLGPYSGVGSADVTISPRGSRPPIERIHAPVDIVVCIHNALDDVRDCLASVQEYTQSAHRLILVDDGSEPPTRDFLSEFARTQGARLIRNEQAGGYTKAANAGLSAGDAPFVVLLNSDTQVGPQWLERLHACLQSDPTLAMAGPLSNCASWQSVPEIESKTGGDWADNPLPEGVSPACMAERIAADSQRIYPRLSFLNGFCQMIRRAALSEVGVRVEVHNDIMQDLCEVIYDPTFFIQTSKYDDQTRTFCTNKGGFVAMENYSRFVCVNGHAYLDRKSENTNFAFLSKVVLTEPVTDNQAYGESIGHLATLIGGGKPILQRFGDLKRGRRSTWHRIQKGYITPTLTNVVCGDIAMALPERILTNLIEGLEKLNRVVKGVSNDETLLYAPEIKFFATQVDTDQFLETGIGGMFVAGDGPGVAGNIVSAAATGLIPAKAVIERAG